MMWTRFISFVQQYRCLTAFEQYFVVFGLQDAILFYIPQIVQALRYDKVQYPPDPFLLVAAVEGFNGGQFVGLSIDRERIRMIYGLSKCILAIIYSLKMWLLS